MVSLVAYLGIASGVALVLTGLGVALARPRRAGGWLLAAFLTVWGTETALFNSFLIVDDLSTVVLIERVALALVLVETLFLVHFTVRFTRSMGTRHSYWSWAAVAFVVVAGAALGWDPSLFSQLSGRTDAAALLILVNLSAFYVTVGILADRHANPRAELEHREVRIVLLGLTLYASYTAGFYLSLYSLLWAIEGRGLITQAYTILFAVATVFLLWLAWNRWRLDDPPEQWTPRERTAILTAILAPLAVGLLTGTAQILDLPRIDLFGLPRLGAALLIAYGLLKFEIFDIDRKVKTGLRGSAIAGSFIVVFFVVSETIELLLSDTFGTWAGLGAAGLLTLGFSPLERKASDLADRAMPDVEDTPAYQRQRKVEVYQAAVERAMGDEVLTEREKEILEGLRDELGLRDNEAREIEERFLPEPVAI